MRCEVGYTDGRHPEEYDTIQEAMTALLIEYPDGVASDAGGFPVNESTRDKDYDIRSGRAALVWPDEETAGPLGLGDDGSHAVAEITVLEA